MGFFDRFKIKEEDEKLESEVEGGYVELDSDSDDVKSKILVRPFMLTDFDSIKPILDSLREQKTIALVNIRPLKDKDLPYGFRRLLLQ